MNQDSANQLKVSTVDHEIHMERVINFPREKVWRAMTDPELISKWWGRSNRLEIKTYEPQVGGFWHFIEHADGEEYGFRGRFREISPIHRIVRTFEFDGMPGHVIVEYLDLEDLGGSRTRLASVSQFHTNEERDGMAQSGMAEGSEQSYQALERVLESLED